MDRILEIAKERSLRVVEDAAHAFPAAHRGRPIGTLSDATCFSFYATKTITTGEGGMVTTDDEHLAERVRLMSLHGISKHAWKRYEPGSLWHYEILDVGYKYNLTDMAAALGTAQLARHRELFDERVRLMERYRAGLADVPGLTLPSSAADVEHAWHLFVVQLDPERLTIGRDRVIELLMEAKIGTSVHFMPLHLHPYYRERFGYRPEDLPVASEAFRRNLSLPLFPGMKDDDVDDVIDAVTRIVEAHVRR
jgi:dTDP-4-amino-4,6-dideoxygalactose transaminase